MRFAATLLCAPVSLLCFVGCATTPPPTLQCPAPTEGVERLPRNQVIAKWQGTQLTYAELFDSARGSLVRLHNKYQSERFEAEQKALGSRIAEALLEKEAASKSQTVEAYVAALEAKIEPATDSEVEAFYNANAARIPQTLDQIRPRLQAFLTDQKKAEAIGNVIKGLRDDAQVEVLLPPPMSAKVQFALDGRPHKGNTNAKVVVVEFADFECPFCARAATMMADVAKDFPNDVVVYFMHFPLNSHPGALPAAIATECAHQQGKFWPFHDRMFDGQKSLNDDLFLLTARELGLDLEKFKTCREDDKTRARVMADREQGIDAGVGGTPAFYVNGVYYPDGVPDKAAIERELSR